MRELSPRSTDGSPQTVQLGLAGLPLNQAADGVRLPPQPAAVPSFPRSHTQTDAQNCVYNLRVAEMGPVCVCGMVVCWRV